MINMFNWLKNLFNESYLGRPDKTKMPYPPAPIDREPNPTPAPPKSNYLAFNGIPIYYKEIIVSHEDY